MADRLLECQVPVQDLRRLPRPELIAAVEVRDLLPRQTPGRPPGVFNAFGKQAVAALPLQQVPQVHLRPPVPDEVDGEPYSRGMGHALPQLTPPST